MEPNTRRISQAQLEPENEFDKFAVAIEKCDVVVGHLSKEKTGRFTKTFIFLCGSYENSCKVEVTGKRVKLHFTGDVKYIDKLKKIFYRHYYKYIFFILFSPIFDHKRTKVRIKEHIFALGTEKIVRISKYSNYRGSN